jgi:hypothetical protein
MAIRQPVKSKSDGTVANPSDTNNVFKKAALFKVSKDGTILTSKAGVFLLNPSTLEDSGSSKWNPQETPGQSGPILQWSSTGARTVTFEALVTADTSTFDFATPEKPAEETDPLKNALNAVSEIASSFFKIAVPPARQSAETKAKKGNSLDISEYLFYYKSLLYPTYDNITNPRKLRQSPPLLVLYAGSAIVKVKYEKKISAQHDLWVLTDLKTRITKQLPNLAPMEAVVQFTLVQYNVRSFDRRRFSGQ